VILELPAVGWNECQRWHWSICCLISSLPADVCIICHCQIHASCFHTAVPSHIEIPQLDTTDKTLMSNLTQARYFSHIKFYTSTHTMQWGQTNNDKQAKWNFKMWKREGLCHGNHNIEPEGHTHTVFRTLFDTHVTLTNGSTLTKYQTECDIYFCIFSQCYHHFSEPLVQWPTYTLTVM